jgi:hypothetical protein
VFTVPKDFRAAAMLRADLAAADIPYEDDAGRVVDFHSLRVTFGTNLARGGVALQLAQRLLRHSTPVLTANVYTVLGRDDDRKAIEKLPEVGVGSEADTEAVRATGTDAGAAAGTAVRASAPTRTSGARRSAKQPVPDEESPAPASQLPPDPRLAALISAWNHLDEQARTVLVRTAEVMARGS